MIQYIQKTGDNYRVSVVGDGVIAVTTPSEISLNLVRENISRMQRSGDDLIIDLANGEQIIIQDFFVQFVGQEQNSLFLSSNGEIREITFSERLGRIGTVEYGSLEAADGSLIFDTVFEGAAVNVVPAVGGTGAAAAGFGGLGGIAGIAAGVGGLGILAAMGGGGSSDANVIPAAVPVIRITSGTVISGTGEPGAAIGVDITGDGIADLTTTVAANGTWSVTPNAPLADGTAVSVIQTDSDGNQSLIANDVADATPPTAPVINVASGTVISGTGEPGAAIGVDITGDGIADLTTTVAANGTWSVTPNAPLADGTAVSVIQTDPDGNQSPIANDVVDATPPDTPNINVSSSEQFISGTAEAGSSVHISYVGAVNEIVTLNPVTTQQSGAWNTAPNPFLNTNEDIYVSSTDTDGNRGNYILVLQGNDDSSIDLGNLSGDLAIGVANFDIEAIDLSDNASNSLIITEATLQNLSDGTDTVRIEGAAGNTVNANGATPNGTTTVNGEIYNVFDFAGGSEIWVDTVVMVVT